MTQKTENEQLRNILQVRACWTKSWFNLQDFWLLYQPCGGSSCSFVIFLRDVYITLNCPQDSLLTLNLDRQRKSKDNPNQMRYRTNYCTAYWFYLTKWLRVILKQISIKFHFYYFYFISIVYKWHCMPGSHTNQPPRLE